MGVRITGGNGASAKDAIVINAGSSLIGVSEEYSYIEKVCGKRDVDYTLGLQMNLTQDGRDYDVLHVIMKDGAKREFWFDITSFYGKF